MIKSSVSKVEIKGNVPQICVELEDILRAIRETLGEKIGEDKAIEIIDEVVANSKKSDDDRNNECDGAEEELFEQFKNFLMKEAMKDE